jgi:ubiquinol-cytochrome c reductase cytochrome b subunit
LGGLFLEGPNFEPANPMSTPEHIAPVWYFTPYYAILRAVPNQRMGALLMGLAVLAFFFLPWLDRSPVKSIRYKPFICKLALAIFAVSFVALGYLGLRHARAHLQCSVLPVFRSDAVLLANGSAKTCA